MHPGEARGKEKPVAKQIHFEGSVYILDRDQRCLWYMGLFLTLPPCFFYVGTSRQNGLSWDIPPT